MPPKSRQSKRKRGGTAEEPPAPTSKSSSGKGNNKKKKNDKPSKRSAATASSTKSAANQISLLSSLLHKVQVLSTNKAHCTNALNALMEGRVAFSIPGFDPSVVTADGTNEKKDDGDVKMGGSSLTLAEVFARDSAQHTESPSKKGGKKKKQKGATGTPVDPLGGHDDLPLKSDVDDTLGRNEAHLIMAVTQAINVILSSHKVADSSIFFSSDASKDSVNYVGDYTFSEAIILAALSSHLIKVLMINRPLFETITKASRGGGSSHSIHSNDTTSSSIGGTSMMDVDTDIPSSRSSPSRGGTSSSAPPNSPEKNKKNIMMSHAKAVVGRALTSAVMGALWSLEVLGTFELSSQDSVSNLKDDGSSSSDETKVQLSMIRSAMWSSLLALESLFQLSPNPKLLMHSSATSSFGGSDSDDYISSSSLGSVTSYSSRLWSGHAHSMMSKETIDMWSGIMERIYVECDQLCFTLEGTSFSIAEGGRNNYLFQACQDVTDSLFSSENDSKLIAIVMGEIENVDSPSASKPPPSKKARKSSSSRSKKTKQLSEENNVIAELSTLLRGRVENHVMFDCHVSVRRWAVLAFAWLCKGQKRLLGTCITLMMRDDLWYEVMELPPLETQSAVEATAATTSKKKSKKKDTKKRPLSTTMPTSGQGDGVPGNLSLQAFICCMIDMIYDAGSTAGITPPATGWMDEYVKAVVVTPVLTASSSSAATAVSSSAGKKAATKTTKTPARRSSRSKTASKKAATEKPSAKSSPRGSKRSPGGGKSVWIRPDISMDTLEVATSLTKFHTQVLQDTYLEELRLSSPNASHGMRSLFVNVDVTEGNDRENKIRFYPYMHRTLETLGRAASTNSSFASFEGKARVLAVGSAFALSSFERKFCQYDTDMSSNVIVLDAKMLSFAVNEIYKCLGTASVTNPSELIEDNSIPAAVLTEFMLDKPILAGDDALYESGSKKKSNQTLQSSSSHSSAETLATFIRAQLSPQVASHRDGIEAFLRCLFHITRLCYDWIDEKHQPKSSKSKKSKKKKTSPLNHLAQRYPNVAFLASDVVKTLGSCLSRCNQPKDASTDALLYIRSLFRTFISSQQVLDFVQLGGDLSRMINTNLENNKDKASSVSWVRLFRAHVDLALVMGHGHYRQEYRADMSIIRDRDSRLEVYQAIHSDEGSTALCLSAFNHALLSSTLSSLGNAENEDVSQSELYWCNSFVDNIGLYTTDFKMPPSLTLGDDLISFRDAQLFAVQFGKLTQNDQKKVLSNVAGVLTNGLKSPKLISQASFEVLSRGIALCAAIADIFSVQSLLPILAKRLGTSRYDFPVLNADPKAKFHGIFDWHSTSVPVPQVIGATKVLEASFLEMIQTMSEVGIATGLESFSIDGSINVLLSSWNISTKLVAWKDAAWSAVTTSSAMESMNTVQKLVSIREDMFGVHSLVDVNEDSSIEKTLLSTMLKQKGTNLNLGETLHAALSSIETSLKNVTGEIQQETSPALSRFVLFEFLPIYVSFLVSKFTKPGKNVADALDRFYRANGHDGHSDESCCSEASVSRSTALERLHNYCYAQGVAPCYPDWLDLGCKMIDGTSQNTAIDAARQALTSLTQFGAQVFRRYFDAICQLEDGRTLSGKGVDKIKPPCVALQLISPSDKLVLKAITNYLSSSSNFDVSGCVQRISGIEGFEGWKANQAERRANGHWEMLLLEALTQGSESKAVLSSFSSLGIRGRAREKHDVIKKDIESVIHWRRILLAVVNALVPSCALLRFGISGKGRGDDPSMLSYPDSSVEFSCSGANLKAVEEVKETLTFLSLVSAYSANDAKMLQVCTACANQLLQRPSQFKRLTLMSALRIRYEAVHDALNDHENENSAIVDSSLKSEKNLDTLLTCFGIKEEKGRLISFQDNVDFKSDVLSVNGTPSVYGGVREGWEFVPEALIKVICSRSLATSTRIHVVRVLIDLIEASKSFPNEVGFQLATAINEFANKLIVLVEDICLKGDQKGGKDELELSEMLARLVSYLVSVPGMSVSGSGCDFILSEMMSSFNNWAVSAPSHSIRVMCLLASRFGLLHDVGNMIISFLQKKSGIEDISGYVDCVKEFFAYTLSLDKVVNPVSDKKSSASGDSDANQIGGKESNSLVRSNKEEVAETRTCSFVETGEGFVEQHWYNCYTCGLLWDKGCCSLCARVCHQGHDIGYSRKSSFFCDCGAEVDTAVEENRTPCKCLVPVSEETLKATCVKANTAVGTSNADRNEESDENQDIFIVVLVANFKPQCKQALVELLKTGKDSNWTGSIISALDKIYSNELKSEPKGYKELLSGDPSSSSNSSSSLFDLESRSERPLKLETLSKSSILPLRAARSNTVQPKVFSSGSSSNQIRKSRFDRLAQMVVSDERGRLFIAESTSVLFCLAPVNVRHLQRSAISSHLTRSKLNILGSGKVKFSINGMALSPGNSRHLLIWGDSKAAVAIISKGLDSFERVIELKMPSPSESSECESESEYLVKCDWVSHSELMVVVVSGTVIHVFNLNQEKDNSCDAATHYALAYEDVLIRSAAMLDRLPRVGSSVYNDDPIIETKLALLLDTGRLYFINLIIDEDGHLEDQGENYIEVGAGVSFPTAGIRKYQGAEPMSKSSTSTTLGEGANISYLRQSNLLLYQCMNTCVVAFVLDDEGAIISNFEILPNMIPAADLGGSYAVVGPYHHFEELGVAERDGDSFYRFTCVGKSTRTSSHPILLLVEFNKNDVFIRELDWPTVTGLGIMSSYSYVGSCAYSCPHLVGGRSAADGYIDGETKIEERACLTLVTSSGSILTFGEDYVSASNSLLSRSNWGSSVVRTPDIFIFETLINISEDDELVLGGDCVEKDPKTAKSKLSLNSSEYLVCPSRDGCTLTVGLQPQEQEKKDLVIVAVRVLVGTMPDLIPSEIAIVGSGRSIKLKRNAKRWYDFPLTDEEILLAVRNGFVSIWISSCHDGNSPVIDCVEVYARKRDELSSLIKAGHLGTDPEEPSSMSTHSITCQPFCRELVPCLQSLTNLLRLSNRSDDALNFSSLNLDQAFQVAKGVLERTALDQSFEERREALILLSEAERDVVQRVKIEDESTVRGLLMQLQSLDNFLRAEFDGEDEINTEQESLIDRGVEVLLLILSFTTKIVQKRGQTYRKIMSKLILDKTCESSIAMISKGVIDFLQTLEVVDGGHPCLSSSVAMNSKLILNEMACSNSDDFAQFKVLEEYLSLDSDLVKSCCAAMRSTITGGDKIDSSKAVATSPPSPEKDFASEGYVTYQCDSCAVFPITGTRYTLGGEMDIDLCKQCYDKGIAYARTHDLNEPVEIDGRTLSIREDDGDNEDMTCAKIWQMGVRAIETSSLEQAEEAKRAGFLNNMTSQKTTPGTFQSSDVVTSMKQGEEIDVVSTEGFASSVFTHILQFISSNLTRESVAPSMYVLQLAVDLVLNATTEELKISRGKEMVAAFTKHLGGLVEEDPRNVKLPRDVCTKIIMTLRSLTSLVLERRDIMTRKFSLETKGKLRNRNKDKTDPRFVCDVHGVPAVRRRCSHGVHKDRRFYVCGLERKNRCTYFKWSDDTNHTSSQGHDGLPLFEPILQELQGVFAGGKLEATFCGLVSSQYHRQDTTSNDESDASPTESFPSSATEEDRLQDKADGVFLALAKFGKTVPALRSEEDFVDISDGTTELLLHESIDLFSNIAPKRNVTSEPAWSMDWFPILCEIISGDSGTTLRALAKKMLQRLCGFRNDIYHKVRDHYVFGFQYGELLQQSCDILDAALLVREQARQCGRNWRDDDVTFRSLPVSGLFGTEDLISEDCMKREEDIGRVLDELLSHAKRGGNWKIFCGGLPDANQSKRGTTVVSDFMLDMIKEIYSRPPIVSLMWLGSCLRGSNQVKALHLVDIALEDAGSKGASTSINDSQELMPYIGGNGNRLDPEKYLAQCMTINDVQAFVDQFVLSGRSKKLRSIASVIAIKLAVQLIPSDRNKLFKSLIEIGMSRIGSLGQDSENFNRMLKLFIGGFGLELDLRHAASSFCAAFTQQMIALNQYCERKCDPNSDEVDVSTLDFDMSDCEHCHKQQLLKRLANGERTSSDDGSAMVTLPEQLRPYQRGRLEASTAATCFSEFSTYYQLKFRIAVSQVHINISDPRGRFAKTIAVYFSPRQVSSGSSSDEENVNILKSDSYSRFWQKCGTINLPKGASEATLKLKHPVVAANLKITFEEFYERNNSTRSDSDGPVLYCPRCTRQVTNAHGVCGHCGEVAFQCRKCRHINYDRLDAFLCVECGYCTSGAFHYELTAGIAVNAVAIMDEEQAQTSMAMLRVANKRKSDTAKKLTALLQKHRKNGDNLSELSLYGPHLKRAMTGNLPKSFTEDKSDASISTKPVRSSSSSSRSRLLSLARSLRQDGDSLGGGRGEFLRQALLGSSGPGGDDYMDDALLNALSGGSGSSGDPLSRLVANMQSRSSSSGGGDGRSGDGDAAGKSEKKVKLSPAEECRRLYMQKREAEREIWELNRKIDSWYRLNSDTLTTKLGDHGGSYMTTDCSICCSKIAYDLLSLLHSSFQSSILHSEHTISNELIKLLLQESADLDQSLKDLKRQVVITIASKSESASLLVLDELKLRLTLLQDRTSAQILGDLIQMDFKGVEKFIELAISVLEAN